MTGSAMDELLNQLRAVPGVVGGLVYGESGLVVASSFPPLFDEASLREVAALLASDGWLPEWLTGEQAGLDLRFADGRLLLRPFEGAWLLVLCTAQVNQQLLQMSLAQVVRRLRRAASSITDPNILISGTLPRVTPGPMPTVPMDAAWSQGAPWAPRTSGTMPVVTMPPPPPPAPSPLDRLREIVRAELGAHAAQALEILAAAGEDPRALADATTQVEKLTRLFINKKKAEELGRKMREILTSKSP